MEIESFDKTIERRILIGMISDTAIVSAISSLCQSTDRPDLFKTDFANLIAKWSLKHFRKYGEAINTEIRLSFQQHSDKYPDDERVKLIGDLLESLDSESEHQPIQNRDYLIDQASKYFTGIRLERIAERIKSGIQSGNIDDSLAAVNSFSPVELGVDMGIDPIRDETAIRQAFESAGERLIDFSEMTELDDANLFFGDTFGRDTLVGFLASEKAGKSWVLLDLVVRAIKQGRRVAYFEVGDMSQHQVMMRLMQRIIKRPKKGMEVKIPKRIELDEKFNLEVSFDTVMKKGLSPDVAVPKFAKFSNWLDEKFGYDTFGTLRLSCHPSGSISVVGIESRLDAWERIGWKPDIIVIDYADILAPIDTRQDKRHQVDETWKRLRGLSQKRHVCVITASQADAASYKVKTLDKANFSESKTKLAHVNALIGINATADEREKQVRRLNFIVRREEAYSEQECLYVAGCLAIGNPLIISELPKSK